MVIVACTHTYTHTHIHTQLNTLTYKRSPATNIGDSGRLWRL